MFDDVMFLLIIVGMGLAIAYLRGEVADARGSRVRGERLASDRARAADSAGGANSR